MPSPRQIRNLHFAFCYPFSSARLAYQLLPRTSTLHSGKVDKASLGIGVYQLDLNLVAHVESLLAPNKHAISVRVEGSHKSTLRSHSSHDSTKCLTYPDAERHSGYSLPHVAFDFSG